MGAVGGITVPTAAHGQDSLAFFKALDLETAGKYRDAVPLFRAALRSSTGVGALLGLERVYAELGWSDSLIAPVDTLVRLFPGEPVYRMVQLRTLQGLGRDQEVRRAFERWIREAPRDPSPYREFAKLLLQRNESAAADTVIRQAREALGSTGGLSLEIAQLRAATGFWEESARAWRAVLAAEPYLAPAAVYALAPTPAQKRQGVRTTLLAAPADVGARRALADLDLNWGAPADAWDALKGLTADSATAAAWTDFAQRAEAEERWALARDALVATLRYKRTAAVAIRAATAALNSGDPAAALLIAPLSDAGADSSRLGATYVPLHARALSMLGRTAEAARLVAGIDSWLTPGARQTLTRIVAWGWVRRGDMVKARAVLAAAGADADSSDAAGWLALYDGNLRTARVLLRTGGETTPELALALGLIARVKADTAPLLGHAFLALARGDSIRAATEMVEAAEILPEASSLLLATAAQLRMAVRDEPQAIALWKRIVEQESATPEAPQAELEWARALRQRKDNAGAAAHLEHLILTYPQSALVPEARRELNLARSGIPGNT